MVVSTAGHWTTGVFSKVEPTRMDLSLFELSDGTMDGYGPKK